MRGIQKLFTLISIWALLASLSLAQETMKQRKTQPIFTSGNPVAGSGTPGQISKWAGVSGAATYTIADSNIFEDKFGKMGIGTSTPTSLLTVQGMIETTLGGYKFPDGTVQTTAGLSSVFRDASLMGNGTSGSPLGVALGGVTTAHLANGAVIGSKLANGTAVRSLNGLFDNLTLVAGANVTITPSSNTLIIAAANALTGVTHDATLQGNGILASPLGVAVPLALSGSPAGAVFSATNSVTTSSGIGVLGHSNIGVGVQGEGFTGVVGMGRNESVFVGGVGVLGRGGAGGGLAGDGVDALGGDGVGIAGNGVLARGGNSTVSDGGHGVFAIGGAGGTGKTSGDGMRALGGGGGMGTTGGNGVFAAGGGGSGLAGAGLTAEGGNSSADNGGPGIAAFGGAGSGAGKTGGDGIFAQRGTGSNGAPNGRAGNFIGDVQVAGNFSVTGAKMFRIDHPLDPENKYLNHAAIESSEVLNIYSGNITTDANGDATVALPDWFEAVNRDFRYQLTVVGAFAQAVVADEIKDNRFVIKSNSPNVKVSWQVTGVRSDAGMQKHPFKAEEDKTERERGYYLTPEVFNQPEEKSIDWARNPSLMRKLKRQRLEAEAKIQKQQ